MAKLSHKNETEEDEKMDVIVPIMGALALILLGYLIYVLFRGEKK